MRLSSDRLGKVSITVEEDYWNRTKCYDKLVVVEVAGDGAYLSRKPVPKNTDISNRKYWIRLGKNIGGYIIIEQSLGNNPDATISQKVITEEINRLDARINAIIDGGVNATVTVNPIVAYIGVTTNVSVNISTTDAPTKIIVTRNGTEIYNENIDNIITEFVVTDTVTPQPHQAIVYKVIATIKGINVSKEVTLNVEKQNIELSWGVNNFNYVFGQDNNLPTISKPQNISVVYESTNPSIASIDETTGVISIIAAGTTTIKAKFAGNEMYNAAEASYILTVSKGNVGLTYSQETVGILTTDTQQQIQAKLPTLSSQHPVSDIEFNSTNMNVATIDSAGHVTVIGTNNLDSNSTEISASVPASNPYYEGSASYLLTVSKVSAPISWSAQSANGKIGETYVGPALSNDENLTIVYQSTNPNVATINSSTGVVTLVGEGTTTIKARFAGNNIYKDTTKSYTLNVTREIVPAYIGAGTSYSAVAVDANKVIDYTGEKTYSIPVTSGDNIYIIVPQGVTYSAFMGGQPMGLASEGTVTINGNVYDVKHTIPFASTSTKTFKLIYD